MLERTARVVELQVLNCISERRPQRKVGITSCLSINKCRRTVVTMVGIVAVVQVVS